MPKIQIVADSTCDLSPELKEKYHITTIPLCIVLDDKSYYDGEEIKYFYGLHYIIKAEK